ncbi:TPA: hypothetical protein ACG05V_004535 [Bacillus pacificus]|uniref:Uncharacterized protein n=1 Tax=Bacillus pacificus TaxID=2026187 RepID=A0ABX6I087_9BACI|nr:hypothetical protein [Bacillus cereus]MCZ7523948.1 hypothetical protein [Bacillus pacificus]MBL3854220.1 hypothetical protein [Bacillus cereus]QHH88151.1 hypothetical protein FPL01_04300 [Bacillus pacificus]RRA96874.1 hypothetical protein EH195_25385 [Bacillus pacificus]
MHIFLYISYSLHGKAYRNVQRRLHLQPSLYVLQIEFTLFNFYN